ncbi:class I SAM-dependent methyltransferase [Luteibacter sp. PPL201]|uniref:Class I SAM-dependent methyltransferase n=1 Tax=Luteibacter sahnii TaxID=3021977 RepID=A0ABT6B9Q6_9GAMM|nr:class I SAM-dependent methyltransferase [Luteibacter sp. PPL193]MDY1546755.1 class I SAM-dependent methyltransferase [Luteibacter sp. PPL193]
MTPARLVAVFDALTRHDGWRHPDAFVERAALADRLDLLLPPDPADAACRRAAPFLVEIEALDARLFARLRRAIAAGDGAAALAPWLDAAPANGAHYDALDALLAGVLALDEPEPEHPAPPPEMVFYQPTPARHIVDCVRRARIGVDDTVLDLGAGMGHVPMLASILTGCRAIGVEREPAYVASAVRAARGLGLDRVSFHCADAREARLDDVDVVYLFTPFVGRVLAEVVDALARAARRRALRIVTLGPCSATFARQAWLRHDGGVRADRVAVFETVTDDPD